MRAFTALLASVVWLPATVSVAEQLLEGAADVLNQTQRTQASRAR